VLRSRALQAPIARNPPPGGITDRSTGDGAYWAQNHRAGERAEGGIAGPFLRCAVAPIGMRAKAVSIDFIGAP
jgi:hypothetical protein